MRRKHALILVSILLASVAVAVVASAGDPPGPPETTYSYTLQDLYNRLDTGAAGTAMTFTEPLSGPQTGTMHTLDEIYDLIGKRAFVPRTGQTTPYVADDDGDLQKGVEWITTTRFLTGTTGVVTDTLTGLVWLENANCFGLRNWDNAVADANGLASGSCGLTDGSGAGDWRLPNVRELLSLIDYGEYDPALPEGHPFTGVEPDLYWSSTTYAFNTNYALYVYLNLGLVQNAWKTTTAYYVWPVRGGP
jgi:hypothetical protein